MRLTELQNLIADARAICIEEHDIDEEVLDAILEAVVTAYERVY